MKINLLFLCSGRQKLLIILPAFQFFLSRRPIGMLKIRISLQTSADVCRLFVFLPFDVSEVLQRAEDYGLTWPLSANVTNADLKKILYPPVTDSHKRLPDYNRIRKELMRNNTKTAVVHNKRWEDPQVNRSYHELAEHYGTAIIPARIRHPKDKPSADAFRAQLRDPSIREISFEDRFALMVDAEYNNYKTLYVRLSDRHRASRSNQRHLHEGSLWSTQVIATEVAQFLSDTWLTRHRKGGSAALEYSKSSIIKIL